MGQAQIQMPHSTWLDITGAESFSFKGFNGTEYYAWASVSGGINTQVDPGLPSGDQIHLNIGHSSFFGATAPTTDWIAFKDYDDNEFYIWGINGSTADPGYAAVGLSAGATAVSFTVSAGAGSINAPLISAALDSAGVSNSAVGGAVYIDGYEATTDGTDIGNDVYNIANAGSLPVPPAAYVGRTGIEFTVASGGDGSDTASALSSALTGLGISNSVVTTTISFDGASAVDLGPNFRFNVIEVGVSGSVAISGGDAQALVADGSSPVTISVSAEDLKSEYSAIVSAESNFVDETKWKTIHYVYENSIGQRHVVRYLTTGGGSFPDHTMLLPAEMVSGALPLKAIIITDLAGDTLSITGADLTSNNDLAVA